MDSLESCFGTGSAQAPRKKWELFTSTLESPLEAFNQPWDKSKMPVSKKLFASLSIKCEEMRNRNHFGDVLDLRRMRKISNFLNYQLIPNT